LIASIKIEGQNQNNILSTWTYDYNEPYSCLVEIEHWWWKGYVNFQLKVLINNEEYNFSCNAFIPQQGYIWAEVLFDLDANHCEVN
jgi:hypothetical protein